MKKYKYGDDYRIYDMELMEELFNRRICGIPLSFYILDLRKTNTYCHITSDFLTYCMKDATRVQGTIDSIHGSDKTHSWVEKGDFVYETTSGLVWKKSSYYEKLKPINCIRYSSEQVLQEINEYLQYGENMNEMYVAWIQDLTENMDKCPYRVILKEHILRFKEEKDLDNKELNQSLLKEYLNEMKRLYAHMDKFMRDNKLER